MANIKIFNSASELPVDWDCMAQLDLFLQQDYLIALEKAKPKNIDLFYVIIYVKEEPCGLIVIQRVKLYLQDIFRKSTGNALVRIFRKGVSSVMKGNILVVGNLTHTGQHGLYYKKEIITESDFIKLIFDSLDEVSKLVKRNEHKKVRLYLLKDYFSASPLIHDESILSETNLYRVKVQPNMVFNLNQDWQSIDDYYLALNKKYKRRYRNARKRLDDIIEVELVEEDVKARSNELHRLYRNVSDNAKLNMFVLPKYHFYILKKELKSNFRIYGYFHRDELIGFYTLIINGSSLETYFLGYDPAFQYEKQLYLNMLYNMLSFGIENNLEEIVYARTAMEIKSSIGAKPKEMIMYMKHTTPLLNRLLKPVFNLLDPTEDWQERHPFN